MHEPAAFSWVAAGYIIVAVIVLAALLASLLRVFRGPTPVERLLAAQLMGTAGVSSLLLMDMALKRAGMPIAGLPNVALVFAILAGVAGVAFVHRGWEWRPLEKAPGEDLHDGDA